MYLEVTSTLEASLTFTHGKGFYATFFVMGGLRVPDGMIKEGMGNLFGNEGWRIISGEEGLGEVCGVGVGSLCSSDVYRCESDRCCTLTSFQHRTR